MFAVYTFLGRWYNEARKQIFYCRFGHIISISNISERTDKSWLCGKFSLESTDAEMAENLLWRSQTKFEKKTRREEWEIM